MLNTAQEVYTQVLRNLSPTEGQVPLEREEALVTNNGAFTVAP